MKRLQDIKKYYTAKKILNSVLARIQYLMKLKQPIAYPPYLMIEPINICNGNCALCPVGGFGLAGRKKGHMPLENFKNIIDDVKNFLIEVLIYSWGDPLLHKDIYKMINYAHKKRISTHISTNLYSFNPDKDGERMIKSGLDKLVVSCHGISRDTYKKYHRKDEFNKTLEKIKKITKAKKMMKTNKPEIIISFVPNKFNEHEIPSLEKTFKKIGAKPEILSLSVNTRFIKNKEEKIRMLKKWLPKNKKYIKKAYSDIISGERSKKEKNKCKWPWNMSIINWDGTVSLCCGIFHEKYDIGNTNKNSIKEIWKGKEYQKIRESFRNKKIKTICSSCGGELV
jgi:radical SAM protein with 4Fe4S-binding SPASM domain